MNAGANRFGHTQDPAALSENVNGTIYGTCFAGSGRRGHGTTNLQI
jgi:hypothetical protein